MQEDRTVSCIHSLYRIYADRYNNVEVDVVGDGKSRNGRIRCGDNVVEKLLKVSAANRQYDWLSSNKVDCTSRWRRPGPAAASRWDGDGGARASSDAHAETKRDRERERQRQRKAER